MSKPTIFFSHSSLDSESLKKLKELFLEKTSNTIDVFLSSDGQSIPLGRNWVYEVQESLGSASIMIVFLTPNSITSNWVYFESGYVYAKNIRVIPVGFLGIDLSGIKPPLGLLQGFNIKSEAGLNNLIGIVNDEFKFSHDLSFTETEYNDIINLSNNNDWSSINIYSNIINQITIELIQNIDFDEKTIDVFENIKKFVKTEKFDLSITRDSILGFGIRMHRSDESYIEIKIDSPLLAVNSHLIHKICEKFRRGGVQNLKLYFEFNEDVHSVKELHKITSRLYNTGIKILNGDFEYEDLIFSLSAKFYLNSNITPPCILIIKIKDEIDSESIFNLIKILVDRNVLYS